MMDWREYRNEDEIAHLIPEEIEYEIGPDRNHTFRPKDADGKLSPKLGEFPVRIPSRYVKVAEYFGDLEIFASMGLSLPVGDDEIEPPSLGVWSLLETLGSPFVNDFENCTKIDVFRAIYVNRFRREAAPLVRDWFLSGVRDGSHPFDLAVMQAFGEMPVGRIFKRRKPVFKFAHSVGNFIAIRKWFELSFNGYAMIQGGSGGSGFWYGAEVMGSNLVTVGAAMGIGLDELLWDTPLIIVGHANAAFSRANGGSVARPKDRADNRRQAILALLRELHGELHPWQIEDPLHRPLTWLQKKHGGKELIDRFDKIRRGEADKKNLHAVKRK